MSKSRQKKQIKQPVKLGYGAKKHPNNQGDPKDQFIFTSIALRNLQKKNIIPSQITPTTLNSSQIRLYKHSLGCKYLFITNKNIAYYGQLNTNGIPQSNHGIFIFVNGSYYQGQIKNGKPQGQGKLTNIQNSYSYFGQWKKGLPHGIGKQIIDQNIYQGEFVNGKKWGKGILKYRDGSYYQGNFKDNVIQGQGKYFNKNNYWEGNWINGYMQGRGRQIIAKYQIKDLKDLDNNKKLKEYSQYTGQFVKGQKSGFGNFKWDKKHQYEGCFKKGQLDGEGIFKFKGKVYAGAWSNGTDLKISQVRKGTSNIISNSKLDMNIISSSKISNSVITQNKNHSVSNKNLTYGIDLNKNQRTNIFNNNKKIDKNGSISQKILDKK